VATKVYQKMGASASTPTGDSLRIYYTKVAREVYGGSSIHGGDDTPITLGGLADTVHYGGAVMSVAKQQLIRDIASDMAEKIKIPKLSPKNKSLDEVVKQLKDFVPDPRQGVGNKKIWSNKDADQVRACTVMAQIINDRMGSKIIDTKAKPGEICENVVEVMHSLLSDMHAEFSTVRLDVRRILKNIKVLTSMLDRQNNAINAKLAADRDSTVGAETATVREAHKDVLHELDRQTSMLEAMMGEVIKPAEILLDKSLKDVKEFKNLVQKIRQIPGTKKFAEKVSFALSGIRSVAQAAKIVDDALRKLGMKYTEYAKIHSPKQLREYFSEHTQSHLKDNEELLREYEKAKAALYNQQYHHDDVLGELAKLGDRSVRAADESSDNIVQDSEFEGAGEEVLGGAKLDKRVVRRQEVQRALLRAFAERLNMIFDKVLVAADGIGKAIKSGTISLSDNLEKLPKALDQIPDIEQRNVYYALAGYYDDVHSREDRETFVSGVKYVVSVLDDLLSEKSAGGDLFSEMKRGLLETIKLIEEFSTKFREGFGTLPLFKGADESDVQGGGKALNMVGRVLQHTPEYAERIGNVATSTIDAFGHVVDSATELSHKFTAGGNSKQGGDANYPEITRTGHRFSRLKDVIRYYVRSAKMRASMASSAVETKQAGEDYIKILADAIANSVDECARRKNFFRAAEADEHSDLRRVFCPAKKEDGSAWNDTEKREQLERLKRYVVAQCRIQDTKTNMYRIAEAVDLYMNAFANSVAAKPDDIRDVLKVLNNTEIISKWFTETSGDMLCRVFETFPGTKFAEADKFNRLADNEENGTIAKRHYYVKVATVCQLGNINSLEGEFPEVIKHAGNTPADWDAWTTSKNINKAGKTPIGPQPSDAFLPGNPFLSVNPYDLKVPDAEHTWESALKSTERALSIGLLKNIISVFVTVGGNFDGKDLFKQTHMSPIQIYKGLNDYIAQSAFALGLLNERKPITVLRGPSHGEIGVSQGKILDENNQYIWNVNDEDGNVANHGSHLVLAGPSHGDVQISAETLDMSDAPTANNILDVPIPDSVGIVHSSYVGDKFKAGITAGRSLDQHPEKKYTQVAMRAADGINTPFSDDYRETDKLFVLVIKSMVAKILTTVGVYNALNRPINKDGLGYFSDLRMIVGGALDNPKVVPEILELYMRLPLLAEYYRAVFNFEATGADFRKINMVPELDGVFSGLVSIIMDRSRHVVDGSYSETDKRAIIEEINKIWLRFKDSKNVVSSVIKEFISEINRRIGVYEAAEREKYLKEKAERYKDRYTKRDELVDYELSTIDEYDTYARPAPSMSYQTEGGIAGKFGHKHKLDIDGHTNLVNELRNTVSRMFEEVESSGGVTDLTNLRNNFTMDPMIRSKREELRHAKTDTERYNIVSGAISSLGRFGMTSLEKSYIMFHETVATPLSVLYSLYHGLSSFKSEVDNMYIFIRNMEDHANLSKIPDLFGADGFLHDVTGKYYLFGGADATNIAARRCIAAGTQGLEPCQMPIVGALPAGVLAPAGVTNVAFVTYNMLNAIITAYEAAGDHDLAQQAFLRFVPDRDTMFKLISGCLYNHSDFLSGLIAVRYEVGADKSGEACAIAVNIDHSKLRQTISDLLNGVKLAVDKFRGLIPKVVVDRYESYENEGSLFWLEKHLVDELIEGKLYSTNKNPYLPTNDSLDASNLKVQKIMEFLTRTWGVNARGYHAGALPNDHKTLMHLKPDGSYEKAAKARAHEYDTSIYEMIYAKVPEDVGQGYDTTILNAADIAQKTYPITLTWTGALAYTQKYDPSVHTGIHKILFNTSGKIKDGLAAGECWTKDVTHVMKFYYDPITGWPDRDGRYSVFFVFNRLIATYLTQIYDSSVEKVYASTLNDFVNAFSSAIMGDESYADASFLCTNFPVGMNVPNFGKFNGVLLKSLSVIIKQLSTERTLSGDKKQYLESDLAEIPLFMKEKLKCNLPILGKMFRNLIQRCENTKVFVKAMNIEQSVNMVFRGENNSISGAWHPYCKAIDDISNKRNMLSLLDKIVSGCSAILNCIKTTLADLADSPQFFETKQGFIAEYESINGRLPFMPLSSACHFISTNPSLHLLPIYNLGSPEFATMYGTRGLLNGGERKIPGMVEIMKHHNQIVESKHQFDETLFNRITTAEIDVLSHLVNTRYTAGLTQAATSRFQQASYVSPVGYGVQNVCVTYSHLSIYRGTPLQTFPYSMQPNITQVDVVRMTENSFQNDERRKIVALVEDKDPCNLFGNSRKAMLVINLIDLNVVPINIHVLKREIPLVNLYNYAWTFDKMIGSLLGTKSTGTAKSGRDLMSKLLLNPYGEVDNDEYYRYMSKISRGDLGIEGFGRPKYWADEVYNKALFGEIYSENRFYEEGGPATAHGRDKGTKQILSEFYPAGDKTIDFIKAVVLTTVFSICSHNCDGGYDVLRRLRDDLPNRSVFKEFRPTKSLADAKQEMYEILKKHVDRIVDYVMERHSYKKSLQDWLNICTEHSAELLIQDNIFDLPTPINAATIPAVSKLSATAIIVIIITAAVMSTYPDVLKDMLAVTKRLSGANKKFQEYRREDFPHAIICKIFQRSFTPAAPVAIITPQGPGTTLFQPIQDYPQLHFGMFRLGSLTGAGTYLPPFENNLPLPPGTPTLSGSGKFEYKLTERIATTEEFINSPGLSKPLMDVLNSIDTISDVSFKTSRDIEASNKHIYSGKLHYLEQNARKDAEIRSVDVGEYKPLLQAIGKMRFDTKLVRNLFWLTNIQRVLRLKLSRDLRWFDERVVSDLAVTAPAITELHGNEMQDRDYPESNQSNMF
jgi:hypothetical protein